MHITWFARFQDQPYFGSCTLPNQMVVDGRNTDQTWDRCPLLVHTTIAQDQELVPFLDGMRGLLA